MEMKSVFNRFNFVRSDGFVHIVLFSSSSHLARILLPFSVFLRKEREGERRSISIISTVSICLCSRLRAPTSINYSCYEMYDKRLGFYRVYDTFSFPQIPL